jgi:hypothetical protein
MSFYDEASWVLIPEGIKEDVVYAQKPTDGLGDLQFTRASDATRTNSAGVIERTPWNLVTFSEEFSNAAWAKSNATISINSTTAPNGTLTADTLNVTANIFSGVNQSFANLNGSYTSSIYAKKGTKNWLYFIGVSGNAARSAWFNLDTGAVGTVNAGVTATIENVGNGWYRCTAADTRTGTGYFQIGLSDANGSQTPASSGTAFIWGAQLVEGTDAKPYFATTNRQDVPRLDYRNADGSLNSCPRLLLEPQRTQSIRNSTMVGAVAGSPGTIPTNWGINAAGLTQTIVSLGTENGLQYIDLRFNGTASSAQLLVSSEGTAQIVASNGQTWTNSFYFKSISAPTPPNSYNLFTIQRVRCTSGGAFTQSFTPTTTLSRYAQTVTTTNASTTHIQPYFLGSLTNGAAYDFTIRIAAPQMELGAYATTFIPTTTAAVTRLADAASKTGVSSLIGQTEGTIFINVNNRILGQTNRNLFQVSDSTGSNFIAVNYSSAQANTIRFFVLANGGVAALTFIVNTEPLLKLAVAYKNGVYRLFINGTLRYTQTGASFSSNLESVYLGVNRTLGDAIGEGIDSFQVFKTELTNAQLAEITTL